MSQDYNKEFNQIIILIDIRYLFFMGTNSIELKALNELLNYNFFIPSYQRGYRWGERQIIELLNDIYEFIPQRSEEKSFYCLQPVIVKKEGSYYKLIDGQQRLTTIFIILSYLGKKRFSIEFETRERSRDFLENLSNQVNDDNIDFFYISSAYSIIQNWFEVKELEEATITDEFYINLGKYTKVLWYEIGPNEDEIDVFTRINSGKIPLTDAELIKALFLNSKNFIDAEKNLKQIEIAKEWDEIEFTLQNDEFWYFLSKGVDSPTRIILIFEIIAKLGKNQKETTYQYFANNKEIVKEWAESEENVKKVFLSLKYWFENRKLFHLIGFLIAAEKLTINEIYQLFKKKTKSDFQKELQKLIRNGLNLNVIRSLEYESNYQEIFNLLLLFNVSTILNNSNSYIRFAFDKFNTENWSLEHIHAQKDKGLMRSDALKKWFTEVLFQIQKTQFNNVESNFQLDLNVLIQQINDLLLRDKLQNSDESVLETQSRVFELFGEPNIHSIDNIALLSSKVNSALSNNIFPIKRDILISKDKGGEFIPICTKNVFLKYYSGNITNFHFWSSQDRNDYLEEIITVLNKF